MRQTQNQTYARQIGIEQRIVGRGQPLQIHRRVDKRARTRVQRRILDRHFAMTTASKIIRFNLKTNVMCMSDVQFGLDYDAVQLAAPARQRTWVRHFQHLHAVRILQVAQRDVGPVMEGQRVARTLSARTQRLLSKASIARYRHLQILLVVHLKKDSSKNKTFGCDGGKDQRTRPQKQRARKRTTGLSHSFGNFGSMRLASGLNTKDSMISCW